MIWGHMQTDLPDPAISAVEPAGPRLRLTLHHANRVPSIRGLTIRSRRPTRVGSGTALWLQILRLTRVCVQGLRPDRSIFSIFPQAEVYAIVKFSGACYMSSKPCDDHGVGA